jgi:hypothetical protein
MAQSISTNFSVLANVNINFLKLKQLLVQVGAVFMITIGNTKIGLLESM